MLTVATVRCFSVAGKTDKILFIVDSLCLSIVRVIKRQLDEDLEP